MEKQPWTGLKRSALHQGYQQRSLVDGEHIRNHGAIAGNKDFHEFALFFTSMFFISVAFDLAGAVASQPILFSITVSSTASALQASEQVQPQARL